MKKILKIAKLELSLLFYSPIAWLILIIFIIQCGVNFVELLEAREAQQQLGYPVKGLTMDIFGGNQGFFAAVQNKLYLYIPLLTMGLMSRELSSGSLKLLLSSPVTNRQIILGKFLSMMLYGFLLVLVLMLIVGFGAFFIENLDFKFLIGGILGLYLLICAYAAIGLFMSSLTSYQVVAAVSTLAVLAALNFVGEIGQSIDYVRDITYWISIQGRADNFINGLISTKDLIYFILVIGLFLLLTIMRLNSGREIRSSMVMATRYALVVIVVLFIGYFSSLPAFDVYYDTTRFKEQTLTQNSQELLEKLEEPLTITTYVNVLNVWANVGAPKYRIMDLNQFDKYTRFLPDLEMRYVPYYDYSLNSRDSTEKTLEERGRQAAIAYGYDFEDLLTPEEIREQIDLVPELNLFVRTVEYEGRSTFLRMFFDMVTYPEEAEISAAIKRLLQEPPVVGVLSGNDERRIDLTGDRSYKDLTNTNNSRGALINKGFDVVEIAIDSVQEIPIDLAALVIADPFNTYSEEQAQKINNYVEAGGNMLIAGEPGKQSLLNPIIEQFGLTFKEGMLLQESEKFELDLIQAEVAEEASKIGIEFENEHVISLPGAVGISINSDKKFNVIPVLKADSDAVWNKSGNFDLETDTIVFDPQTDLRSEAPLAVAVTRKFEDKQQKIVVIGDADFMSNGELGRFNLRPRNYEFTFQMFKWFSDGEFPVDTSRPEPIDNTIQVSTEGISWFELLFIGGIPVVLGFAGAFTLVNRKRK
ncbi:Gldg family protein [Salinimicrobium sp. WS361]|uniref:Gldg family protein n=1 Tax=Salinimicrobium sp. WS361 TaxID=3425123 RepID=UPI003D6DF099